MRIVALDENGGKEKRVALTPETVARFLAAGHSCVVVSGAGIGSGIRDEQYREVGARLVEDATAALAEADLLLRVTPPDPETVAAMPAGSGVLGLLDPQGTLAQAKTFSSAGVDAFAMELVPRVSRAQAMDALSSQANLAGYRAVIEAAHLSDRVFPMMITAAGSVAPVRVFVMGAGVAGLQAIATARRLGAVVSATDVRPAAKQQVESLAAKFVAVEDDEFLAAESAAGYAKPMSEEYRVKQEKLITDHITDQDVVITTALIPGRPAPVLIPKKMLERMRPGALIIDLAVAQGGNCPYSKPDRRVIENGVVIIGMANLPSAVAADASALYARNLHSFVPLLTGEGGAFAPSWDDELVAATVLARGDKQAPKASPAADDAKPEESSSDDSDPEPDSSGEQPGSGQTSKGKRS